MNNFFLRFVTVSEWQRFYVDVGLYYCYRLKGIPWSNLVEIQILEAQLVDSDSIAVTSLTSSKHTIRKVLKIWSDDWRTLRRAEFLSLIAGKELSWYIMLRRIIYTS
jgi:hypothetical protein